MVVIESGSMLVMDGQNRGKCYGGLEWSEYKVALYWSFVVIVMLVLGCYTRRWQCGGLVVIIIVL